MCCFLNLLPLLFRQESSGLFRNAKSCPLGIRSRSQSSRLLEKHHIWHWPNVPSDSSWAGRSQRFFYPGHADLPPPRRRCPPTPQATSTSSTAEAEGPEPGPIRAACAGKGSVPSRPQGFLPPGESSGTRVRAARSPQVINERTEQRRDQYFFSEVNKTSFESRTKYLPHTRLITHSFSKAFWL